MTTTKTVEAHVSYAGAFDYEATQVADISGMKVTLQRDGWYRVNKLGCLYSRQFASKPSASDLIELKQLWEGLDGSNASIENGSQVPLNTHLAKEFGDYTVWK